MDNNAKFFLKEKGCVPFEITKEEYDRFVAEIKKSRKENFKKSAYNLCDLIGIHSAKCLLGNILNELEERENKNA